MLSRYHHGHSLGAGLIIGLMVTQRPWLVFAAGVIVGVSLVFAMRVLRRLATTADLGIGWLRRKADAVDVAELEQGRLTPDERERERRLGLRQGEAAGIRAAARQEARDQARRDAMLEASNRFGRQLSQQSLARALDSR